MLSTLLPTSVRFGACQFRLGCALRFKAHISEMFLQVDGAKIKAKIDCLM